MSSLVVDHSHQPSNVKISFENIFNKHYLRNNRGGGKKNIRCFPFCSPGGHVKRGFCGNKIHVKVEGLAQEDIVTLQIRPVAS